MKDGANQRTRLEGVIVEAVTPRRAEELSIDLGAILELVDFLAQTGVKAIALLGTTGEFVHFALHDRIHMVRFAAKRSRLPLVVNVSHSTLDGAIELAREATAAGVAGVMLMPPYYYRYSPEAIRAFYLAFAATVGNVASVYISNVEEPGGALTPTLAAELLATGRFAGIHDSSGSLDSLEILSQQAARTPFTLLAGQERTYVQAKRLGADGVVSGVACAAPELMVALDDAICAGAEERIVCLEARLIELLEWIDSFPLPAALKAAVNHRKLKAGVFATPLGPEDDRRLGQFREWFAGWLRDVLRECKR
jgi:4-hydroxy-tetrahydrodipicolinate synthase